MGDTDCRKCGEAMPPTRRPSGFSWLTGEFKVTAYRCPMCDHWNDLKRRKPKPSEPPQESSR